MKYFAFSEINECRDEPGSCDQYCYDRSPPAGFTCRCDEDNGWVLDRDKTSCKSTDPAEPYLVISNKYYIRYIQIS